MSYPALATTHLRRYTNTLFMIKEYIHKEKIDEHEPICDTLMVAIYGIENIISDLEKYEYEERLKEKLKSNA